MTASLNRSPVTDAAAEPHLFHHDGVVDLGAESARPDVHAAHRNAREQSSPNAIGIACGDGAR